MCTQVLGGSHSCNHMHLIARRGDFKPSLVVLPSTAWIVSAVVSTVRVWNSIQQQKFGCEKCSSKAVHLSFIFSIPKRYHRALSIMNKMNSLAPTVPYSLQIYAAFKQPCAANKSFPIGEVTPFNFKNCAELNNLFLFNIWGIERFNIKKKTNTKISTAGQFRSR